MKAKKNCIIVLDGVRSGNNVGSLFRTADAFGAERLVLCGITGTPPAPEIHKTALGAELTVPWEWFGEAVEAIEALRERGYTIVAVEQVPGAVMLQDFAPASESKYALVFGNEVDGVSQAVLQMCDMAIEIPQVGTKKSLNVAVAGGVVLWKFLQ